MIKKFTAKYIAPYDAILDQFGTKMHESKPCRELIIRKLTDSLSDDIFKHYIEKGKNDISEAISIVDSSRNNIHESEAFGETFLRSELTFKASINAITDTEWRELWKIKVELDAYKKVAGHLQPLVDRAKTDYYYDIKKEEK